MLLIWQQQHQTGNSACLLNTRANLTAVRRCTSFCLFHNKSSVWGEKKSWVSVGSAGEHSRGSARIMSSIQLLRVLVNERLSAAAEEIFEAVKKTIAGYEEEILLSKREIRRQRRMLQTVIKPEIKINKHSGSWMIGMYSLFRHVCSNDPDPRTSSRATPTSAKHEVASVWLT